MSVKQSVPCELCAGEWTTNKYGFCRKTEECRKAYALAGRANRTQEQIDKKNASDAEYRAKNRVTRRTCSECPLQINSDNTTGICSRPSCHKKAKKAYYEATKTVGEKRECSLCKEPIASQNKSGICTRPTCIKAQKAQSAKRVYDKDPGKVIQNATAWNKNNPEARQRICKVYYQNNKEALLLAVKEDRQKNPEKYRKRGREYVAKNPEKTKRRHREDRYKWRVGVLRNSKIWAEKNPDKVSDKYRKWVLDAPETAPFFRTKKNSYAKLRKAVFERDNHICQICGVKTRTGGGRYHPLYPVIDHIRPVAPSDDLERLDDLNTLENLQTACLNCNSKKNNTSEIIQWKKENLKEYTEAVRMSNEGRSEADIKHAKGARYRARKNGIPLGDPFTRRDVFERDDYVCEICDIKTSEEGGARSWNFPVSDHIIPHTRLGCVHSIRNSQTLCNSCNSYKLDRLMSELPWDAETGKVLREPARRPEDRPGPGDEKKLSGVR